VTAWNIWLDICDFVLTLFAMTHPAAHLPEEDDDAPDWAREQLEVLRELRDMGMTLARNLTRRVVAETEAAEAAADAGEPEPAPRAWRAGRSGAVLFTDIADGAADPGARGAGASRDRGRRVQPGQ
jgi:hypothetical protein